MQQWLQNFAYQIELKIWIFAMAAEIVLLLAGTAVIIQTLQTATDNPVKSLRSE
jgi:putative ABC transport system permease protein